MKSKKKLASEIVSNLYQVKNELNVLRMESVSKVIALYFEKHKKKNETELSGFYECPNGCTLLSNWNDETENVMVQSIEIKKETLSIEKINVVNSNGDTFMVFLTELADEDVETLLQMIISKI